MNERISDAALRSLCDIIRKTDVPPDGENGTVGEALRAAALDLVDARAEVERLRAMSYHIFLSGLATFCAVRGNFTNRRASPAGFGATPELALKELYAVEAAAERQAHDALKARVAELEAETERLRVEWLCTNCKSIHPRQRDGIYQPCPKCGNAMAPTSLETRERDALKARVKELEKACKLARKALYACHDAMAANQVAQVGSIGEAIQTIQALQDEAAEKAGKP